jgi:nitrite reductase/ring-hydroxylating ferredoxin subunit
VVEVGGAKILVAESDGKFYAVANKCAHMGISLVGKTALLQGKVEAGCITCPAHGSKFELATGAPVGEWCPNMPAVPFIGEKLKGEKKSQPTYESRVSATGEIEVLA